MISASDVTRLFSILTPENQQRVLDYMEMLSANQELSLISADGSLDENLTPPTVSYLPEDEDEELKLFLREAGRRGQLPGEQPGVFFPEDPEDTEDPELLRFFKEAGSLR